MNKRKKPNQLVSGSEINQIIPKETSVHPKTRKINDKEITSMASKVKMGIFLTPIAILSLIIPFSVANVALANTTTSVVCYFKNGSNRTWKWGLNSASGWYQLNGRWDTKDGITVFRTKTSGDEIRESCNKSRQYYNLNGHSLDKVYASDSAVGKNYIIYSPKP